MRLNSLRSRMTAAFALALAGLTFLFVSITLQFPRRAAEQSADAMLKAALNGIRSKHFTDAQLTDSAAWCDVKEALSLQNLALVVVDAHGRILQKTDGTIPPWPQRNKVEWRLRTLALGDSTVIVGLYWHNTEHALRINESFLILHSILLLACATFGVWFLVGRTLSPIDRLARQADAASIEDLQLRLKAPSHDVEIVHLVGTLNGLLSRLSETLAARGRFYAAASHELRTPLQTLTGYLEVALMQRRDADEYRDILAEASAQAGRLTSLIQALLLLNQVEAAPAPRNESIDIAAACDRWLRYFQSYGDARGLSVEARLPERLDLEAAPAYVDILLRNLLENAFKYAITEDAIRLHLEATPQGARLTLFNACSPLPDWDAQRLFEPFYRPDVSRNSETGGNGLGLAICKAVADASGWNISLSQSANGVEVSVLFS